MKLVRVILFFLLLGAIVNVAVAWTIALIVTYDDTVDDGGMSYPVAPTERWVVERRAGFGTHYYFSMHFKYVPIRKNQFIDSEERWGDYTIEHVKPIWGSMDNTTNFYQTLPSSPELPRVNEQRIFEARGWPMRSLWCLQKHMVYYVDGGSYVSKLFEPRGLIATPIIPDEFWGPRVLPLYPIGTGFVVNTLFYAAILSLLFTGPFVLRRFIRRRRGLCVQCAYDLRGAKHEACPECGHTC